MPHGPEHVFVWGGYADWKKPLSDGALYDPELDTWTPISQCGAPESHAHGAAVWTGKYVVLLGGDAKHTGAMFVPPA